MWASVKLGDNRDLPYPFRDMDEGEVKSFCKSMLSHPNFSKKDDIIGVANSLKKEEEIIKVQPLSFSDTGEGWFETHLGMTAGGIVKRFRKARRHNKEVKIEIDNLIKHVRHLKRMEVDATLKGIGWAGGKEDTIRSLGLTDRNLKSLRLFHDTRKTSLLRACDVWDNAESSLKMLDEYVDVWGDGERKSWVAAMELRKDARKMWRKALHQIDSLTKEQQSWINAAKEELVDKGAMKSKDIINNLISKGDTSNRLTPKSLSKMLNMYGEEVNIFKGARKSEYVVLSTNGLIIKDVWAYGAGFLDADGYIMITKRGEPRAGFIATGKRGRLHCEQLHKVLDCGVLQLDQKVYKDGQRSQHRISFYSKDDLRKLLQGIGPHLKMKSLQSKAVLEYIDSKDSVRKDELRKVVTYSNWSDNENKAKSYLDDWGINQDTIGKWAEGL